MLILETTTTKDTGFISLKQQSKKYIIKKTRVLSLVLIILGVLLGVVTTYQNTNGKVAVLILLVFTIFYWSYDLSHIEKAVNELL